MDKAYLFNKGHSASNVLQLGNGCALGLRTLFYTIGETESYN